MSITDISVKRPTMVVVLFSILVLLGLVGYSSLTYELLPKISSPVLTVTTVYPGAGPGEVETSVSKKVEEAISTMENLESTQAISQEGASVVIATLKYGTDIDKSLQEAQRKVDAIVPDLPDDGNQPSLGKFSFDEMPIMRLGATSEMDETEFTNLFEKTIKPEFARIEGVAKIDVVGGENREIKVNVDGDKLRYYNVSITEISGAINRSNSNFPTGSLKNTNQDILVRLSGRFGSTEELSNLIVHTQSDGSPVYLRDVAEIFDSKEEISSLTRINGATSLGVLVTKTSDGNTVGISEEVKGKLADLEKRFASQKLKFTIAADSADFTLEAANSVIHDLLIAIVLVAFIMLFFLHNIRNAIIVMIAIPVSIVATFSVMFLLGFSLNLMTLLALSLVVGILVDDSIVVLENIHMYMEQGATAMEAAKNTWNKIGVSVTSITLVIIVVFLPITFVSGIVSDLLFQFSIVVVSATIISWLVSFTLTPWLASRFTKISHLNKKNILDRPLIWFENFLTGFQNLYRSILKWSLAHKRVTFIGLLVLSFSSFGLLAGGFIGAEFVANGDNGEFQIQLELPKDVPVEQTNFLTQNVEEILLKDPNITTVFTTVGQSSAQNAAGGTPYLAEVNVKLVPAEERTMTSTEYAAKIKLDLQRAVPGTKITAAAVGMVGGATAAPIQYIVRGANLDSVLAFTERAIPEIKKIAGTREVKASVEGGNPEIAVNIDREKMAELGLTLDMVGATMQNAYTGNDQSKLVQGDEEYPIRVQLDQFDRKNLGDIRALTFLNTRGQLIKLSQFASTELGTGPTKLERKDKISSVTLESQLIGRPVATVAAEVEAILDKTPKAAGIEYEAGGDVKNQQESFASLGLALLASILLVYLIMVALYDNYVYPLVVMLSIPVAMLGAFLTLALTMTNLSIFGMLGLIMLIGLVIKNAILIVDFTNELKAEGRSSYEAIVEGTMARFRPILMTTIAMVIAMIPIAVASGAGAEWKNGLAWVLIGGLTSSMLLTLILVPVGYLAVDIVKERSAAKRARKAAKKEAALVVA